jgi:hypothetical protein
MFTRFSVDEVYEAAPSKELLKFEDTTLVCAVLSLMRIAGADSPDGGAPEVDAMRALNQIRYLLESQG